MDLQLYKNRQKYRTGRIRLWEVRSMLLILPEIQVYYCKSKHVPPHQTQYVHGKCKILEILQPVIFMCVNIFKAGHRH